MNAMQLWKGALVVTLMAVVLAYAGTAMAGTITQAAGADHLAFEFEDFDSLNDIGSDGVNWTVISDAGASGGQALKAPAVIDFANEGEAIYHLEFTKPTDFYRVYARYKNLGSASSDSFLTTNDEPAALETNEARRWFEGPADQLRSLSSSGTLGTYYYAFIGAGTIEAAQWEFRAGIREKETEIDRIIFVDGTVYSAPGVTIDVAALDGFANSPIVEIPEPASLALLALGMLATVGLRRRQG